MPVVWRDVAVTLKLDWCSHQAAKYACEHWHYSKCMPAGKLVKIGVWENNRFIGAVVFGSGANRNIGSPYQLNLTQVCELVRVALRAHQAPVSKILAVACRTLKAKFLGLTTVISYADPEQGHHGGIYQACGWTYVGRSKAQQAVIVNGKMMHKRSASAAYGTIKGLRKSAPFWKHTYAHGLNDLAKQKLCAYSKPYPKRARSTDSGAAGDQPAGDGAKPIRALAVSVEKQ